MPVHLPIMLSPDFESYHNTALHLAPLHQATTIHTSLHYSYWHFTSTKFLFTFLSLCWTPFQFLPLHFPTLHCGTHNTVILSPPYLYVSWPSYRSISPPFTAVHITQLSCLRPYLHVSWPPFSFLFTALFFTYHHLTHFTHHFTEIFISTSHYPSLFITVISLHWLILS